MTTTSARPAEVFPPGETIQEELDARGWTQVDLANIMGRPPRVVNEIIAGKRGITPETATELGAAFGTSPQLWMNLEGNYQLSKVRSDGDTVGRRARLYELCPVKDVLRRGWVEDSENIDVLEQRFASFFGEERLAGPPRFWAHAARKSTSYHETSTTLCAWLFRARQLAQRISAERFTDARFQDAERRLHQLCEHAADVRHVPKVLAECGIRFVVVEALPQTRIDGACFWLDPHSPVIVLSLRYDRVDWFWFTLMHEMKHVHARDGLKQHEPVDVNLVGDQAQPSEEKSPQERAADAYAQGALVPQNELQHFIARVRPLYSKAKILGFAARLHVHPGIVVGQLQKRGEISYAHSRETLVKVRDTVTAVAVTDGFGHIPHLR